MLEVWQQFEEWLRQNAPGDYSTLRPGASSLEMSTLERGIDFPLHDDLKSLLLQHNGVTQRRSSTAPGAFLIGYSLMSTEGILEWHENMSATAREAVEEGYEEEVIGHTAHAQWVPFAQALTGDLLFVDHRRDHYGEVCEISFGDPDYTKLWPSLTWMLTDLRDAVEGQLRLPITRRRPVIHEGRMLEWSMD
ncbi:SMI1/KNR4 family protein [Streptomyces anulatus]|uniref:SMI1/KNR4 family protein n=1 Tax=Streptomyces anulatus TaxID=1892 RepID=UPI0036660F60